MEIAVLLLFCCILFCCIFLGLPLLVPLGLGFLLFCAYGLWRRFSLSEVLHMAFSGIASIRTIFLVFLLIGILTGLWRGAGTIAYIISLALPLIAPAFFLFFAFLLNCLVSFLLGTAFGTAATMGVITMSLGMALGVNPAHTGAVILCGAYFGDRMSPVSTSALLITILTKTDLYRNLRNLFFFSLVPFLLACCVFFLLGVSQTGSRLGQMDLPPFGEVYHFTPLLLLPALSLIGLSLLHVQVRPNMIVSILLAALLCLFIQHMDAATLIRTMILGYEAPIPALSGILDGGGLVSMLNVTAIVCLSSSYAGIFHGTKMLTRLEALIKTISRHTSPFAATAATALFTTMVSCNQTLAIILTEELCRPLPKSREAMALYLGNTAVVMVPLIPWSIACVFVLDSVGAPRTSILFACYLYFLPLWGLYRPDFGMHG